MQARNRSFGLRRILGLLPCNKLLVHFHRFVNPFVRPTRLGLMQPFVFFCRALRAQRVRRNNTQLGSVLVVQQCITQQRFKIVAVKRLMQRGKMLHEHQRSHRIAAVEPRIQRAQADNQSGRLLTLAIAEFLTVQHSLNGSFIQSLFQKRLQRLADGSLQLIELTLLHIARVQYKLRLENAVKQR